MINCSSNALVIEISSHSDLSGEQIECLPRPGKDLGQIGEVLSQPMSNMIVSRDEYAQTSGSNTILFSYH